MRDEFWTARPVLRYIRDYARATRISPMTLLVDVLTRVSVVTPPNVVLPPLVGAAPGSLNMFVAVVGGPGSGKGIASAAAAQLMPDIRGAVTTQPASGEGLAAIYVNRVPVPEDEGGRKNETRLHCVTPRALLSIEEIGALGGASSRQGSTVLPTLCSAWSGEPLGAFNKMESNRLTVPAHAYRLGLTVGVQPAAAATLFDGVGTGLPQRFLWAETIDPQAPEYRPDRPAGSLPCDLSAIPTDPQPNTLDAIYQAGTIRGALGFEPTELEFPDEAYRESDTRRLAVLHGAGVQPLDSHAMQVKAKVSALLAILEGRMTVSVEDWQLAGQIMDESTRVRDQCLEQMHEAVQQSKADYINDSEEARAQAETRKLETAKRSVLSQLERHDSGHEGIKGYDISRMLGRNGKSAYDAIEALYEAGELDMLLDGDRTSNKVWALPS